MSLSDTAIAAYGEAKTAEKKSPRCGAEKQRKLLRRKQVPTPWEEWPASDQCCKALRRWPAFAPSPSVSVNACGARDSIRHQSEGTAPNSFDALSALENWVERGTAGMFLFGRKFKCS
jgi:hypothetical protein